MIFGCNLTKKLHENTVYLSGIKKLCLFYRTNNDVKKSIMILPVVIRTDCIGNSMIMLTIINIGFQTNGAD